MDTAAAFIAISRTGVPLINYSNRLCKLAQGTLISIFWSYQIWRILLGKKTLSIAWKVSTHYRCRRPQTPLTANQNPANSSTNPDPVPKPTKDPMPEPTTNPESGQVWEPVFTSITEGVLVEMDILEHISNQSTRPEIQ